MEGTRSDRPGYAFDNAWGQARERLALLEAAFDPGTIRHLEALGVGAGWRCLEVGAGGGSIAAWLCQRVGATGHVLATGIDTRFLGALDYPNLTVRRHDVVAEPLPVAAFDLIHVGAVLVHLVGRQQAVDRLVPALKPGGWLLAEESDFASWVLDPASPGADLWAKGWAAVQQVMAAAGYDFQYGRRLYGDLRRAGLVDIATEGRVFMMPAGSLLARFTQVSVSQLRERIVGAGLLTEHELEQFLALYDDPTFISMSHTRMAVWGRRSMGPEALADTP
jgi:SAM-dependent methyltransferase